MSDQVTYDWNAIVDDLNKLLRLRTTPIGMKLFRTAEEMEAIPKIRRPKSTHTTDQIVAQAARLGWTVGITMKDLVGAQCGAVIGLHPQDEEWLSGNAMAGVWYSTLEDSSAHQHADGHRATRTLHRDGGIAAGLRTTQSPRYLSPLRDAGPNDHFHQRPSVVRLSQISMRCRRRIGLRRLVRSRAQNRRTESFDPMLCGAALRGCARRRAADGNSAPLSAKDHRRNEAACIERIALSDSAIRHPVRCSSGAGGILWTAGKIT
jgi:hypothetical protein